MKDLYLIRHAKSSWNNITLEDFDRPLNKRGKINAPYMGNLLNEKGAKPNLIISSPAYRARSTAEIISEKVFYDKHKIEYHEDLYDNSDKIVFETLQYIEDQNHTVFLVGHNPSLNVFAHEILGFDENLPTCGILHIKFDCESWKNISKDNAKLISFEYPKKYIL